MRAAPFIARWYCVDRHGDAHVCHDEADARAEVRMRDRWFPGLAPHRAMLLGRGRQRSRRSA